MRPKKSKTIITYLGSQPMLRVLEIISGQYERFQSPRFIEPHRRNFFSFFLVKTGYIRHSIDFKSQTCRAGEIFFMAPQQVYLVESAEDFGGISVNCQPELLSPAELSLPIIQNTRQINGLSPGDQELADISAILAKMLFIQEEKGLLFEKLLKSYFNALLLHMSRSYMEQYPDAAANQRETALVEKFRGLVDLQWKNYPHLTDYARKLCISPGYLNDLIKENTGRKAMDWIQERKLIEAKRLLLHADSSIKEIAFETGFDDPAYFNRFFKKWTGHTPQQFRQEIRKKYNDFQQ